MARRQKQSSKNMFVYVVVLVLFFIGLWMVFKNSCENYVTYESRTPCSKSYRVVDDGNIMFGRNRCQGCSNYDFSMYEYYCPHNCRTYGVSLCDQGKIM